MTAEPQSSVVILVNGDFPGHPAPIKILETAPYLICTDGSADQALSNGIQPDLVIGDMDSTGIDLRSSSFHFKHIPSQENTDLEKTLDWLITGNIEQVTVVGLTGGREDHFLANLLILSNYCLNFRIKALTDQFQIDYISGKSKLSVSPGQLVSILCFSTVRNISVQGLKFPLQNDSLNPSGHGISNLATRTEIEIATSDPVLVFRSHNR